VPSRALDEERLRRFLLRRRRGSGEVEPPPVGRLLAETLDLAASLVPAASGFIALDDPSERTRRAKGRSGSAPSALTLVAAFGQGSERRVGELLAPTLTGTTGAEPDTGAEAAREQALVAEALSAGRTVTRAEEGGAPASIAVTVRLEHAVCGVLVVLARRGRQFAERDVEIVELLARYASRAILNAVDVLKQNELARRDELTGVRNVRGLHDELDAVLAKATREQADAAVFFVDVDHLKRVNDRLGHAAGSETLKRVGRALAETVGAAGEVYRFGGDEFVVVAPTLDATAARALGAAMRVAVRAASSGALRHIGVLPGVTISVGVATLRGSLRARGDARGRASRLLVAADRALYRAKHAGRDAVSMATLRDDPPRALVR